MSSSASFFNHEQYMPHGMCYLWQSDVLWTSAISDVVTALGYYSIVAAVIYFGRKRTDLPYRRFFILSATLVFLSCGTSHLISAIVIWEPIYGISAIVKVVVAICSFFTGILIWKILPMCLLLPSPSMLESKNQALQQEISSRIAIENEIIELNVELTIARNQAEIASKAKGDFLSTMSHEIRTPMNAMLGFLNLVLESPELPEKLRHHLSTSGNSAKHLLSIINDVLDVSRLDSGKIELDVQRFNLQGTIKQTLKLMHHKAVEKNLPMAFHMPDDMPRYYLGDAHRLQQVLLNLLSNSIKFTEKGSVEVSVELAGSDDWLHFNITDTGIGMSQQQIETIFDPFTQAESSTTRRFGGTGLGTTISKGIVEIMEGKIWVESELGKGSRFHFIVRLPRSDNQVDDQANDGDWPVDALFSPRCFSVLLAEDLEQNAELAILRLEQQGHSVSWVKNGQEVLDSLSKNEFDLILMDVQMPVLDGLSATEKIRENEKQTRKHIPIVALTASVMKEELNRCLESGMDAALFKPVEFSELFATMERVVESGRGEKNTPSIKNSPNVVAKTSPVDIDFSALQDIADINKGIDIWQDQQVYVGSLISFARDHHGDARTIGELVKKDPDDVSPAYAVSHALKGVASNLSLTDLAGHAKKVDENLHSNNRDQLPSLLSGLSEMLIRTVEAINQLSGSLKVDDAPIKAFDKKVVKSILELLLDSLKEMNPDSSSPHVDQLAEYFSRAKLNEIIEAIESFDFDTAKKDIYVLAEKLDIEI